MEYELIERGDVFRLIITKRDKYDCGTPLGRAYMALTVMPKRDLELLTSDLMFHIAESQDAIQWILSKANIETHKDFRQWHGCIKNKLTNRGET